MNHKMRIIQKKIYGGELNLKNSRSVAKLYVKTKCTISTKELLHRIKSQLLSCSPPWWFTEKFAARALEEA